jgi:non-specific protein-tyrosine kinase
MELQSYLSILGRRKWWVILATILCTVVATAISLLTTPQYVASSTLRVLTVGGGPVPDARPDIGYTERLLNTYASIITGKTTREQLRDQLGLEELPTIDVQLVPNTELLRVRAEATNPEDASNIANAAAELLVQQNREFFSGGTGRTLQEILGEQLEQAERQRDHAQEEYNRLLAQSPDNEILVSAARQTWEAAAQAYDSLLNRYEEARLEEALQANSISIVEPADPPQRPARPRYLINIGLGLLVGLTGGIGLAFLVENLDTTLYTSEQIEEATQLPTVGRIPAAKDELNIARLPSGHYPQLESFRRLRTNILALDDPDLSQVVLLTSAKRGEGKSTVSANLAVTIAQAGHKVVVVDCDLRLPAAHKLFDLPNKRGLTDILTGKVTLEDAMQLSAIPRVQVITSGPLPPNPTELLGSQRMTEVILQLKQQFDFVILDTPALLSVADAAVLASTADTVILVVAQSHTRRSDVETVRQQLSNVRVKSMQVVVNRAEPNGSYAYYESENINRG